MADNQSTETAVEQSSAADEASRKLEEMDVIFDTEDDTDSTDTDTEEESSQSQEDESEAEESDEDDQTDEDTTDDSDSESDDEDESKSEQDTKRNKPKTPEAAFNKAMAERRLQEKEQREAFAKQQQSEQQAYLDEADDDPKELALRQLQIDAYENKVERNSTKLTNQYERALKDFDILRSDDPRIQKRLDRAIDAFQAQYVVIDKYGNPSTLKPGADMYTYLQEEADSLSELTGLGKDTQKQNKQREKFKTLTAPSQSPKKNKIDPDMDAFMEEAYK